MLIKTLYERVLDYDLNSNQTMLGNYKQLSLPFILDNGNIGVFKYDSSIYEEKIGSYYGYYEISYSESKNIIFNNNLFKK